MSTTSRWEIERDFFHPFTPSSTGSWHRRPTYSKFTYPTLYMIPLITILNLSFIQWNSSIDQGIWITRGLWNSPYCSHLGYKCSQMICKWLVVIIYICLPLGLLPLLLINFVVGELVYTSSRGGFGCLDEWGFLSYSFRASISGLFQGGWVTMRSRTGLILRGNDKFGYKISDSRDGHIHCDVMVLGRNDV